MLFRELFIYLLTGLVITLSALSGVHWLLIHYPNTLIPLTVISISVLVSLLVIVAAFRLHAKFKIAKSNKGALVGEPLVIGNNTITFRRKCILNKYIVFPEINGKRDESLCEFITTSEDSEVTAAVSRLISVICTANV